MEVAGTLRIPGGKAVKSSSAGVILLQCGERDLSSLASAWHGVLRQGRAEAQEQLSPFVRCATILPNERWNMSVVKEFKSFIARGNVMDLAVGVIIGSAFGGIVKSLTDDIIMPVVGALFGGFDFSNYFLPLSSAVNAPTLEAERAQRAVFAYGNSITVLINFLILAWIIFLMIKGVNFLRHQVEHHEKSGATPPSPPPADVRLLTEIRDLLAKKDGNFSKSSSTI